MATHHQSLSGHTGPTIKSYLLATRPMFLVASLLPVILGTAVGYQIAIQQGGQFDLLACLLALVSVMFVNLGINVLNDVYDDRNGTDRINHHAIVPFTGGSRVIQERILSQDQMLYWGYLLLSAAVITGFFLVLYKGYPVLYFGLAGLFLGVCYSKPPIQLASRGLGEFAIALGIGILPVTGAAWLQSGQVGWDAFLVSIAAGLWVANIILVNEVPDEKADAASGKRTLTVRFGHKATAGLYLMANLLAVTILLITVVFGLIPFAAIILPLVLLVPAILTTKRIRQWQKKRDAFIWGIKFNITSYLLNILWVTIWVLAG